MRKLKGYAHHQCCPADWKQTANMTGSYELDAMIEHTKNKDMADRLRDHLADGQTAYSIRNGYNNSTRD